MTQPDQEYGPSCTCKVPIYPFPISGYRLYDLFGQGIWDTLYIKYQLLTNRALGFNVLRSNINLSICKSVSVFWQRKKIAEATIAHAGASI